MCDFCPYFGVYIYDGDITKDNRTYLMGPYCSQVQTGSIAFSATIHLGFNLVTTLTSITCLEDKFLVHSFMSLWDMDKRILAVILNFENEGDAAWCPKWNKFVPGEVFRPFMTVNGSPQIALEGVFLCSYIIKHSIRKYSLLCKLYMVYKVYSFQQIALKTGWLCYSISLSTYRQGKPVI